MPIVVARLPGVKLMVININISAAVWFRVLLLVILLECPISSAEPPDSRSPGAADSVQKAMTEYRYGHFEEAIKYLDEAIAVYRQEGLKTAQGQTLAKKAEVYLALNNPAAAMEALRLASELTRDRDAGLQQSTLLGTLGAAYFAAGRIDEAKRHLEASLSAARISHNHNVTAICLNNLGNLYASQRQYADALRRYLESVKFAEQADDHLLAAKALTNAARLSITYSVQQDPEALLSSALIHINQQAEDSHDKALTLIGIGQLFEQLPKAEQGHIQKAHDVLTRALKMGEAMDDQYVVSYAAGYLGALYEWQSRLDEALRLTSRAQFIAQTLDKPELLYRWQWQSGRILAKKGDIDGAIAAYQRAVSILQPIRHELLAAYRASSLSFRESVGAIYFELADLLLKRHLQSKEIQQGLDDILEARQTVELVKAVELEDYFQDDCVAALQAKTKGVDRLAPRTAALYPIILPDRTELLLSLPARIKLVTVKIDKAAITNEVRTFRKTLEKRTTREYLPYAQALYDRLIRPVAADLQAEKIDTLVVIPDDPLRTIPLAALHDGKEFLIQKYAVATTPGLALTDPHPLRQAGARFLLSGLTQGSQGFPPLPYVEEELQSIAELYSSRVLEDEEFRVAQVQNELSEVPFSVVHIASHGQFHSDVGESFLLAYDGKIKMDTLEQVMGTSRFRDKPVELLTLSACQTAAGDDRAALGLAGIAVKAGARSALASLWFINDRASALLVSEFYRQLRDPNLSKAKALQLAQLGMLKDKRYHHPGYWAPFLLIGNWL